MANQRFQSLLLGHWRVMWPNVLVMLLLSLLWITLSLVQSLDIIPNSVGSSDVYQHIVKISKRRGGHDLSPLDFQSKGFTVIPTSDDHENIFMFLGDEELYQLKSLSATRNELQILYSRNKLVSDHVMNTNEDENDIEMVKEMILAQFNPSLKKELLKLYSGFNQVPTDYPTIENINNYLKGLETRFPGRAKMVKITQQPTFENRHIYGVKISNNVNEDRDVPNILIVSAHHAREINTVITSIVIIEKLLSDTNKFGKILQHYQIYIIPVVNVDGYHYVFSTNNWWRKNRRFIGYHNGTKSFGVDLNRNYDIGFEKCAGNSTLNSDLFKGEFAFSEIETSAIRDFSKRVGGFSKVLDFHSLGRQVLTGYTCTFNAQQDYIAKLGEELASKVKNYKTRVPHADGEHQEYHIKQYTSYSFLIEIMDSFQPPFAESVKESIELMPLVEHFFNKAIPLRGHVYDIQTGKPLNNVNIQIIGVDWKAGESRHTNHFGSFYLFLPSNTQYDLLFSYQGRVLKTRVLLGHDNESQILDVRL
ncbi:hypothetical protein C9374_006981 [Naegleria lovaniensis]|uniref:Peptidase M14 domain-containing protein n=1 Tax=Naegleria lovaniensis TaxID=51637 RepID=A0AA88H2E1_NAELO|nr:uncharacterized protein C9374_006981 [Naegleria lovaniensis]KAG2393450.1 hypothetical protein C9374_006981 [Naegleria lovaniensis]